MRLPLLAASCAIAVVTPLAAQTWDRQIRDQWPGDSIAKATQSEFGAFAATLPSHADKVPALEAFLAAQWTAHGLPSNHPNKVFLCPLEGQYVPTAIPVDAGVSEGPEPNGDPSAIGGGTPSVMGCGDHAEGNVFPYGDRDWWTVTLPTAQRIVAFTGPGFGGNAIDDTVLEIYDQNGALLTANDDYPARGRFSQLSWDAAAAGTFYVAVRGYGDVRTGSYSLDVICGTSAGGGPGTITEAPEPNHNGATSTSLPCGATGSGTLSPLADSDWWGITFAGTTTIIAETMPTGTAVSDTTLTLRNQFGTQLLFDDDGGSGLYSRITTTLAAGTYYLDVQAYSNNYTGDYELTLACQTSVPEAPEPNNAASTATNMSCGNFGSGSILPLADSDWWRLVVSTMSTVTIETSGGATGPISDTTLTLLDGSGAQIAFDDDGGAGSYSLISQQLTPGVYFADVQAFSNQSTGTYLVEVTCTGGGSAGTASFVPNPGGCSGSAGVPTISARPNETPVLGSTFAFELGNLPAAAPSVAFFGYSTTVVSGSGAMLPLDLAPIGAPGCLIAVDPLAFLPMSAPVNGTAIGFLPVPGDPNLTGMTLHVQAVIVDSAGNQLGLTLSNHGTAVLGGGL